MKKVILFFILIFWIPSTIIIADDLPLQFTYKGEFHDSSGDPVADGIYKVKFRIYDSATSVSAIWGEGRYHDFSLKDGRFEHTLGTENPLPDNLANYEDLWVSVEINYLGEIAQRTKLDLNSVDYHIITLQTMVEGKTGNLAIIRFIASGDTYKVIYAGQEIFIKLIGIDSPERSSNKNAKRYSIVKGISLNDVFERGKQSIGFVKSMVSTNDSLFIEYGDKRNDEIGRHLVYVYDKDGVFLNEEIVKAGYAEFVSEPLNIKFDKILIDAENYAKENKLGHWAIPPVE